MAELKMNISAGRIKADMQDAAARGLRLAAEHVLQEARRRVPIEEGTLERSGATSVDAANLTAAVSFDTPYAVRQHEDLSLKHDQGREAKYLENALRVTADDVQQIIATQLRRAL